MSHEIKFSTHIYQHIQCPKQNINHFQQPRIFSYDVGEFKDLLHLQLCIRYRSGFHYGVMRKKKDSRI